MIMTIRTYIPMNLNTIIKRYIYKKIITSMSIAIKWNMNKNSTIIRNMNDIIKKDIKSNTNTKTHEYKCEMNIIMK